MDDNNENGAQSSLHLSASLWNIPDLPFGIICSYLDTSTLMNLCLVCQKFNSYIKNEISLRQWEKRAKYIWPDAVYPILSPANPDKLFWRTSCAALEKQKVLWTQNAKPLIKIIKNYYKNYNHRGSFNSGIILRLMEEGKAYIVTARHRDLVYKRIESEHSEIYMKCAHYQRISDLTILNNEIYSCSTDNEPVKSWKLNNGHLQMETSYNFDSYDRPISLSSYPGQNVFAVGSNRGCVSIYDSRSKDPMCRYEVRTNKWVCYADSYITQICRLAMNSEYILAGNTDNIVYVCDQRTAKIMKHITMPVNVTCMKIEQDCVFIGDDKGKLHVLNPKNDFELVKSYDIGHLYGIKVVHLTHGYLMTGSGDRVIISSPTDPPKHMYTLFRQAQKMNYQNGTLALSSYNNTVQIYRLFNKILFNK